MPYIVSYLRGERRDEANPFDAFQRFCEKGSDVLEDMVDLFWEQPFAFATFVHHRYRAELTDAFAGRVYETEHQPSKAIISSVNCSSASATTPMRMNIPFPSDRAIMLSAHRYGLPIRRSKARKNG